MPTYSNSNATDVFVEGLRIPAKATAFQTQQWIKTLPSGISLEATSPMFNPILVSRIIAGAAGSETYTIPTAVNGVDTDNAILYILCYGGSCSIALSDTTNTPVIWLVSGESVKINLSNHVVLNVTTTYLEGSTKVKQIIYKGGSDFGTL